tara:strand:- start:512 stop:886 length:375 start_codon:yes stop_codon:yes gene_type:complete
MEYLISNFTDIGIKDIQLKYIENIVEKSIYGIYCLIIYLIKQISNSLKNNNDKYDQLGNGPLKRGRRERLVQEKRISNLRQGEKNIENDWVESEFDPVSLLFWVFAIVCTFALIITNLYFIIFM